MRRNAGEKKMKNNKPLVVSILGWSNSGKTTLIEAAIAECARRGISTAALKKSHNAASLQPDSKDSSRFRQAGADPSIYLSGHDMLILRKAPAWIDKDVIAALCPEASIVFCEGLEVDCSLRVLATGDETDETALKRRLTDIDILIARNATMIKLAIDRNVKTFKPEDVGSFIDHLIAQEDFHG